MSDSDKTASYAIDNLRLLEENKKLRARVSDCVSFYKVENERLRLGWDEEKSKDDKVAGYAQDNLRLRNELAAAKAAPDLTPEFKQICRDIADCTEFQTLVEHADEFRKTVESWPADPPTEPELPPCPNCGKELLAPERLEFTQVACETAYGCGMRGPKEKTRAEAIAAFRAMCHGDDAEFGEYLKQVAATKNVVWNKFRDVIAKRYGGEAK